jgi:hypothetical protein
VALSGRRIAPRRCDARAHPRRRANLDDVARGVDVDVDVADVFVVVAIARMSFARDGEWSERVRSS